MRGETYLPVFEDSGFRSELKVRKVAVLGAGLMGHGIAQVAAQQGRMEVSLTDVEDRFLQSGVKAIRQSLAKFVEKGTLTKEESEQVLGRIRSTLDLGEAVREADLVIEAVPEELGVKREVWRRVEASASETALFASNTSSISITELASVTKRPERFCGMHFFNPPQLMRLVEVIRGARTGDDTVATAVAVARELGKEAVVVKRDVAGFLVNRIMIPAINEAIFLLEEGVADREDIDRAVELGLNWPMGPLRLADYVGLDTTLAVAEVLQREFGDPKFRPSPLLRQMVRGGMLGRKTGKGFYEWRR